MRQHEPPPFDPAEFIRKNADNVILQNALKAISELVERTAPPQPDETLSDAKRRIEQGFNTLEIRFDQELSLANQEARVNRKKDFIQSEEQAIRNRHQAGINATPNLEHKVGGQFERDNDVRIFRENIDTNPKLNALMSKLEETLAARQDAIMQTLRVAENAVLKKHGLDRVDAAPEPTRADNLKVLKSAPASSNEFKEALRRQQQEIKKQQLYELLLPAYPKFNQGR